MREVMRALRAYLNDLRQKASDQATAPPSYSNVLPAEEAAERRLREVKRRSKRRRAVKKVSSSSSSVGSSSPFPTRRVSEVCGWDVHSPHLEREDPSAPSPPVAMRLPIKGVSVSLKDTLPYEKGSKGEEEYDRLTAMIADLLTRREEIPMGVAGTGLSACRLLLLVC